MAKDILATGGFYQPGIQVHVECWVDLRPNFYTDAVASILKTGAGHLSFKTYGNVPEV